MKNIFKFSILFFLIAITGIQITNSQEVFEWRPEMRTGVSKEKGLLKSWPESGPALVWANLELPKGNSSVAFGNDKIYITGTADGNDILVALDLSGKILWKKEMGRAWAKSYPESRATPTVEGEKVYTCSGYGDLACFNGITGEIIWSYKASESNNGTYGNWGIAEALLIDGEKIYYTPGGPETMTIALNKKTGDIIWKSKSLNNKPGYVSPILIEYAGKKMIVNVSLTEVFSVDASNGDILWKIPLNNPRQGRDLILCVTPLFHEGQVYVTGGYNIGGMMVKIAKDGKSADVVWNDDVLDVHHGGVVLVDGFIYGANWLNNSDGN